MNSSPLPQVKLVTNEEEEPSPFIREFFLVQGIGFRCMAYRNSEGKWHGAFSNEQLPGPIRVVE